MKRCSNCGEVSDSFSKHCNSKDGLQPVCKRCALNIQREYRKTAKGKARDKRYELSDKKREVLVKYRSKETVKSHMASLQRVRRADPVEKYKNSVRRILYHNMWKGTGRRKSETLKSLTGMYQEDFKKYLLTSFYDRYERYPYVGEVTSIDHIVPLCTAHTLEEVAELCRYDNLQLLTHHDNCKKYIGTWETSKTFDTGK